MTTSITAFEAPALLDAHSAVTRLELYERLRGKALTPGAPGLTSYVAGGAMDFAAKDAGWSRPVRHDRAKEIGGLEGKASAWKTSDADGEFVAVFQHVPQYMHSISWAKAGVPPRSAALSAIWTAIVFDVARVAVVVLADRRLVTYWVEPTPEQRDELEAAAADMARRVAEGDAPPVDADAEAGGGAVQDETPDAPDLDALVMRWRATSEVSAANTNAAKLTTAAAEAAAVALKAALPKGSSHETDGVRVSHNAKTGRLHEEKTDAAYF